MTATFSSGLRQFALLCGFMLSPNDREALMNSQKLRLMDVLSPKGL